MPSSLEALIACVLALFVLIFVFGSALAVVPLFVAISSIMTTFFALFLVTRFSSISPVVQFLVALVGLGVAIDYALLVSVRWREERTHGKTNEEAVRTSMLTAGRAVAFSGTTVAIGLLALVVLPLPFLRSMGAAGLLIPLASVMVAITLLPVILLKLGPRLDKHRMRSDDKASTWWSAWATGVVRHRWLAAGVATLALGALMFAASGIRLGGGNLDTIAKSGEARVGPGAAQELGDRPRRAVPARDRCRTGQLAPRGRCRGRRR